MGPTSPEPDINMLWSISNNMSFVNPTRNQNDIWVQEDVKDEVSRSSRLYEEKKFSADKVANIAYELDPSKYTQNTDTIELKPGDSAPNFESFTGERVWEEMLENSDVTSIEWGVIDEGDRTPASGPIKVETRSAQGGDAHQFWIPFVDEKRGKIAGVIQPPYSAPEPFTHSRDQPHRTDSWIDEDAMEAAYVTARETIPGVHPDYTEEYDADWFRSKILNTSAESMIRRLESNGEVQVGSNEYIGKERGGKATDPLEEILGEAKERRIIDYTVENENNENMVRIDNGGYKWLTKNVPELHDSIEDVINSRLTQGST